MFGRQKGRLKMQPPSAWSWWLASSTLTTSPTYAAARSLWKVLTMTDFVPGVCAILLAARQPQAGFGLVWSPPGYCSQPCQVPASLSYARGSLHYDDVPLLVPDTTFWFFFLTQTDDTVSQQTPLIPGTVSMQLLRGINKRCRRYSRKMWWDMLETIQCNNFHRAYPRPSTPWMSNWFDFVMFC